MHKKNNPFKLKQIFSLPPFTRYMLAPNIAMMEENRFVYGYKVSGSDPAISFHKVTPDYRIVTVKDRQTLGNANTGAQVLTNGRNGLVYWNDGAGGTSYKWIEQDAANPDQFTISPTETFAEELGDRVRNCGSNYAITSLAETKIIQIDFAAKTITKLGEVAFAGQRNIMVGQSVGSGYSLAYGNQGSMIRIKCDGTGSKENSGGIGRIRPSMGLFEYPYFALSSTNKIMSVRYNEGANTFTKLQDTQLKHPNYWLDLIMITQDKGLVIYSEQQRDSQVWIDSFAYDRNVHTISIKDSLRLGVGVRPGLVRLDEKHCIAYHMQGTGTVTYIIQMG